VLRLLFQDLEALFEVYFLSQPVQLFGAVMAEMAISFATTSIPSIAHLLLFLVAEIILVLKNMFRL
jgi:hypothetical protein